MQVRVRRITMSGVVISPRHTACGVNTGTRSRAGLRTLPGWTQPSEMCPFFKAGLAPTSNTAWNHATVWDARHCFIVPTDAWSPSDTPYTRAAVRGVREDRWQGSAAGRRFPWPVSVTTANIHVPGSALKRDIRAILATGPGLDPVGYAISGHSQPNAPPVSRA